MFGEYMHNFLCFESVEKLMLSFPYISNAEISWFQCQLQKDSLAENDAFAFFKADNNGDVITHSAFCEALRQVFKILAAFVFVI